ncbi:MAG: phage minor head protein [Pseudomonadota bacterium]
MSRAQKSATFADIACIWRTRGDGSVRSSHAQNDGKVFAWDNPPPTGHPGDAPGCRCTAEPYYPEIEEHINVGLTGVTNSGAAWSSHDFINHYFNGGGRGVTLRQTGHLGAVVSAFMNLRGDAIRIQHIATPARRAGNRPYRDGFENIYNMTSVVFSLGHTTISGQIAGVAIEDAGILTVSGDIAFQLNDVFEEPLDIDDVEGIDLQEIITENLVRPADAFVRRRPNGPLRFGVHTGEPFPITDRWLGTFDGKIYADAARSRFR